MQENPSIQPAHSLSKEEAENAAGVVGLEIEEAKKANAIKLLAPPQTRILVEITQPGAYWVGFNPQEGFSFEPVTLQEGPSQ